MWNLDDSEMFEPIARSPQDRQMRAMELKRRLDAKQSGGASGSWADDTPPPAAAAPTRRAMMRQQAALTEAPAQAPAASQIDPAVLDEVAKSDPDLVSRYRAKMQASDAEIEGAQKGKNLAGYSGVVGQLATDFINSQRGDMVYHNRMQDLGKSPKIDKADQYQWDNSIVDRMADEGMQNARQKRADGVQDMMTEEKFRSMDSAAAQQAMMKDPNSEASKRTRAAIMNMMPGIEKDIPQFETMSAEQADRIMPMLKDRWQADREDSWRQKQLSESAASRRHDLSMKAGEKRDRYVDEHTTPFGLANTPDDAKQLKQAYEEKSNFDRKIEELIELREKYGAEVWNREAVARGKQLSKDLLLTYKNMAKLGVLSKADEDIINAIIPPDPLGFRMTDGSQDSILHVMKKFREDSDQDFQNRIKTRVKVPSEEAKNFGFPREIRKDGAVATVQNQEELKEAQAEGWK